MEPPEPQGPQEPQETLAPQEFPGQVGRTAPLGPLVLTVRQVWQGPRGQTEELGSKEPQDSMVKLEWKERLDRQDRLELKVSQALMVLQDQTAHRGPLALRASMERKVLQGHRELPVLWVTRARLAHRGHLGLQDRLEPTDHKGQLARPV